jgi:hypothetical protein
MISKETLVNQITVTETGTILYREATRIIDDGVLLSQTYHRSSLAPASDLTDVPANVVAICNVAWTAKVIQSYKASQNDNANT